MIRTILSLNISRLFSKTVSKGFAPIMKYMAPKVLVRNISS